MAAAKKSSKSSKPKVYNASLATRRALCRLNSHGQSKISKKHFAYRRGYSSNREAQTLRRWVPKSSSYFSKLGTICHRMGRSPL